MYKDFKKIDVSNSESVNSFIDLMVSKLNGKFTQDLRLDVNRILYDIYVNKINSPLNEGWKNYDNINYDLIKSILEGVFEKKILSLVNLPSVEMSEFNLWSENFCENHASNVNHKLFEFLKNKANINQLKKFIYQETPFDIHFGDILAKMLPGVYGDVKAEFSKNFWDEVGHAQSDKMHRKLRLDFMEYLKLPLNGYINRVEDFDLPELELANLYFYSSFNRSKLFIAIGAMLATELMVPGRLDAQIQGWKRVGVQNVDMKYLIEHTIVDVEHADGWIQNVVQPLLASNPSILNDLVKGISYRLFFALNVCDYYYNLFSEESVLENAF